MVGKQKSGGGVARFLAWRDFARDRSIDGDMRTVGLVMMAHMNAERLCWPSLKLICQLTGLGEKRVKHARGRLVKRGFFVREARKDQDGRFVGVQYLACGRLLVGETVGVEIDPYGETESVPAVGVEIDPHGIESAPPLGLRSVVTARGRGGNGRGTQSPSEKKRKTEEESVKVRVSSDEAEKSKQRAPASISKTDCNADRERAKATQKRPALLELLDVDPTRIRRKDEAGLHYLARAFELERPAEEPGPLADWLDAKLAFCAREGRAYPKVMLARLKQFQRGEFIPRGVASAATHLAPADVVGDLACVKKIVGPAVACLWERFTREVRGRPFPEMVRHFIGELATRGITLESEDRAALENLVVGDGE